jgi:DNA-binding NarL/FixJ family response regulator
MAKPIRVVVCGSPDLLTSAIGEILAVPGYDVTTTALTDVDVDATPTDVVVVCWPAPAELTEAVVAGYLRAGTRSLVVSAVPLDDTGARLLLQGAAGFMPAADTSADGLRDSVRTVASGHAALHPEVARAVLDRWRSSRAPQSETPSDVTLSARERQILEGLSRGQTVRQMSNDLKVAEKTVEAHRARLFAKLGARNQAHAVTIANQLGLTP